MWCKLCDVVELNRKEEQKKMKAILVIDMPESCGDCRFCDYNDSIKTSFCTADPSHMFSMQEEGGVYTINRNKQCPLKPLLPEP